MTSLSAFGGDQATEPDPWRLKEVGQLPASLNGRITTWEVMARNHLKLISGKDYYEDNAGVRQPATRLMLEFACADRRAMNRRILPIRSPELLAALKLPRRNDGYYTFKEAATPTL